MTRSVLSRLSFALAAGIAVVGVSIGAAGAQDRAKTVRVWNWPDYMDKSALADFEKETGFKLEYDDTMPGNEELETAILGGKIEYDVVVPTATFLSRDIKAKAYQPLDKSKIPNLKNYWPEIAAKVTKYDPDNKYSINWMWGTVGIGYNVKKVKERLKDAPVDSWKLVYDPDNAKKLKDCGILMLDSPEDILPSILAYLGIDPDTRKIEDYRKATDHLKKIAPFVRKFQTQGYIEALAQGDYCAVVGYSGDIIQARAGAKDGVEIAYSVPKEGAQLWFDQMAIPAAAKNVDGAHAFINYVLKPEVHAAASNLTRYANGNIAAKPLIKEEITKDPTIYPDEAMMKHLFTVTTLDDKLQPQVTRLWTQAKRGK